MNNSSRVIANTAAQYIRTIINLCLSLYSTRVILDALGLADYGIYTLVAGVVSLLSFVINALVVTTDDTSKLVNGETGLNMADKVYNQYTITNKSVLLNNIAFSSEVTISFIICFIAASV